MTFCLDAWAVIAWLESVEPAVSRVAQVLTEERPLMSWINLGEVFYQLHRRQSRSRAAEVIHNLRPSLTLELPSERRVLEAAAIKGGSAVAYADAFAVATAIAHGAVLLTGDPEILDAGVQWPVEDLRHHADR